jgi:predicted nucleic acid-binding protein
MRYLLDTNTCIAAMRHHAPVLQRLAAVAPADCAISSITTYELAAPGRSNPRGVLRSPCAKVAARRHSVRFSPLIHERVRRRLGSLRQVPMHDAILNP